MGMKAEVVAKSNGVSRSGGRVVVKAEVVAKSGDGSVRMMKPR